MPPASRHTTGYSRRGPNPYARSSDRDSQPILSTLSERRRLDDPAHAPDVTHQRRESRRAKGALRKAGRHGRSKKTVRFAKADQVIPDRTSRPSLPSFLKSESLPLHTGDSHRNGGGRQSSQSSRTGGTLKSSDGRQSSQSSRTGDSRRSSQSLRTGDLPPSSQSRRRSGGDWQRNEARYEPYSTRHSISQPRARQESGSTRLRHRDSYILLSDSLAGRSWQSSSHREPSAKTRPNTNLPAATPTKTAAENPAKTPAEPATNVNLVSATLSALGLW
ncbi:hypothetical protein BU16DRAFT_566091 [Lophium mytilinum]|uniref:Uncharacterized protein n=1 Tax=Lophium mytilinum TaxID=390894 RepID=A0A6A6QFK0_9PEZI|nr:hypothetical protein BU16DRAFT_566091 [Lophium mytilinum]